jgi:uncharacterized membrane protein
MAAEHARLRYEHVRVWAAIGLAAPVAAALVASLGLVYDRGLDVLTDAFLCWDLFGLAYAGLTLRVFRGASNQRLRSLVEARPLSRWAKIMSGGSDGPGFSVQFAAIALAAAALLPQLDSFAPSPEEAALLTGLIVLAVVMALVVVTLSYAVHYARLDTAQTGLAFPGGQPPGFTEYLYFSASIATTFGTTDVEVTSQRIRRTVTGHSVLTFVFNSVIIALLVSALTG